MVDANGRHEDHDPFLVASLLDDDATAPERTLAQARIDGCAACASLYEDLVALSQATRTQPVAGRQRDFRLTAEDAARLRAEPVAMEARLTGVMTESSSASAHRTHDTTLVASLADHSLAPTERAAAEVLVAACDECATLHADLVALVAATRAMPTPPRPIDYTLTRGQAARLRPNPWRRLVAATGSSRDGFTRPLAIGLSTLGLVGLLVTSAPSLIQFPAGLGGSAASSGGAEATQPIFNAAPGGVTDTTGQTEPGAALAPPNLGDTTVSASAAPERAGETTAPAYGVTGAEPIPVASAAPQADGFVKGSNGAAESSSPLESTTDQTVVAPASGVDPVVLISVTFLAVGLGLFVLRWSARRLADG